MPPRAQSTDVLAMLCKIDKPDLIDELSSYLKECACRLEIVGGRAVEVFGPAEATDPQLARIQLDGFLRAWTARHPEAPVSVRDPVGEPKHSPPGLMESVGGETVFDNGCEVG